MPDACDPGLQPAGEHASLLSSQASLCAILEASPVSIVVVSPARKIVFANSVACAVFGRELPAVLDRCFGDLFACRHRCESPLGCGTSPGCSGCPLFLSIGQVLEGKAGVEVLRGEASFDPLIGREPQSIRFAVKPLDMDGRTYAVVSLEDVTGRKLTVDSLRVSEGRLRMALDAANDGLWDWDLTTNKAYFSPRYYTMLGYEPDEFEANFENFSKLVHPDDLAPIMESLGALKTHETNSFDIRMRAKSGEWKWILTRSRVIERDAQSHPTRLAGIHSDITDRKRAEEALRESEERFKSIVESSPMGMHFYTLDDEDRVILVAANAASDKILNIEHSALLGLSIEEAFPGLKNTHIPEMYAKVALGEIGLQRFETVYKDENISGEFEVYVFKTGDRTAATLYLDITERNKVREWMVQTEKMMSVGGLAAGMAHEINNPLSGILQNAQVLRQRLESDAPASREAAAKAGIDLSNLREFLKLRGIPEFIEAIRESASRAGRIVASMLQFSRKSESSNAPCDLADMFRECLELCMNDYDLTRRYDFKKIRIVQEFDATLPKVRCSRTQIEQVMLNLIKNAAQSLSHGTCDGGPQSITLRTGRDEKWLRFEVEDNGEGMDERVRRKLFEPFFTTKPAGSGTGLGLSVSFFIVVNNHGGTIDAQSLPGKGARFTVRLPV
jgi:polar amino acid transport system substrate-binding protein